MTTLPRAFARLALAAAMTAAVFSTGAAGAATLESLNASGKTIQVEVPDNPKRLAVIDMAVLDMLDYWGLTDRIVAMPKSTPLPYLAEPFKRKSIVNTGTLKEVDLEALMAAEPDVIFISGRLAKKYDELSKIAPVIYMKPDQVNGAFESFEKNLMNAAKLFNKTESAKAVSEAFEKRLGAIQEKSKNQTALVGLVTAAHVNLLGEQARASLISREMGFKNLAQKANANHGNESSFELLVKLDPDYFFVLDRDSAIARPGAKLAKDILSNEMVDRMSAKKNGRIVYLTPAAWYLGEGGVTSMDIMLRDIEKPLGIDAPALEKH